jgi:hypothetical protein
MSDAPQQMVFRPVRPGSRILNPQCGTPGTLGVLAFDSQHRTWVVSCRHVLLRPSEIGDEELVGPEAIYQPGPEAADGHIADSDVTRQSRELDCAAAILCPDVVFDPRLLGLDASPGAPIAARSGMRVLKSGAQTGVTRGVVRSLQGDTIRIVLSNSEPANTVLSRAGDSGAVWLEEDTLSPVGLHRRGNAFGAQFALASPMDEVLAVLGLRIENAALGQWT